MLNAVAVAVAVALFFSFAFLSQEVIIYFIYFTTCVMFAVLFYCVFLAARRIVSINQPRVIY